MTHGFFVNSGCQLSDKHMTQQNIGPFLHTCWAVYRWSLSYSHIARLCCIFHFQLPDNDFHFSIWCFSLIILSILNTHICDYLHYWPSRLSASFHSAHVPHKECRQSFWRPEIETTLSLISNQHRSLIYFVFWLCFHFFPVHFVLSDSLSIAMPGWSCKVPETTQPRLCFPERRPSLMMWSFI